MENKNIETIAEYLAQQKNEQIEAKPKSLALPVAIIVVSLVLMTIAATPLIPGKYISLTVIFLTLVTLILGIAMLVNIKKDKYAFIYRPTQERLKKMSVYISMSDVAKLRNGMASNNYSVLQEIKREFQSGCCLEIWGAAKSQIYLMQVREYVAYQYQPTSEVAVLMDKNAEYLKRLLNSQVH